MAEYRYYRFQPGWCRGGSTVEMHLSEFAILNAATRLTGMGITNPGTAGAITGEEPTLAGDNSTSTKWRQAPSPQSGYLRYDFGTPTVATGYRWATANDTTTWDPISWYVDGSNDATEWRRLDTVVRYDVTTSRSTFLPDFLFNDQPAPLTVQGCVAWWKADSIVGLLSITTAVDGDVVDPWPDANGFGGDAIQPTAANRPTFQTAELGGLPVVRFDGTNDFLASSVSDSHPEVTQFAVVRPTATTGSNYTIRGAGGGGGLQWRIQEGVQTLSLQGTGTFASGSTTVPTTGFTILSCSYIDGPSGTYTFWHSGLLDGIGTHTTTLTAGHTSQIGGANGFDWFSGDLAELLVYDRVLTEGERAQVHSYLANKYALTIGDYWSPGSTQGPVRISKPGRGGY